MWIQRDFRDINRWVKKNKNVSFTELSILATGNPNGLGRILGGKFTYTTFRRVMKYIGSHPKVK